MARRENTLRRIRGELPDPEDVLGDPGEAVEEAVEAPEEIETSIEDLVSDVDPTQFDRSFAAGAGGLNIQGAFDPVAGDKQVIPRVAYVLNYNLIYNEARGRWEPQKKSDLSTDSEPTQPGVGSVLGRTGRATLPTPTVDTTPDQEPTGTETIPEPTLSTSIV